MGVLIWEAMSDSRVWYGYSSSIRKKSALWMKKSPVRGGGHGDSGDADVGPGFIVAGFVFNFRAARVCRFSINTAATRLEHLSAG